jgi:hypothetical protein
MLLVSDHSEHLAHFREFLRETVTFRGKHAELVLEELHLSRLDQYFGTENHIVTIGLDAFLDVFEGLLLVLDCFKVLK